MEICAGDGIQCNTANLIINHGWNGLMFDGNEQLVQVGRSFYANLGDTFCHPPTIVNEWITRENINDVIKNNGFEGQVDLLSLDLDGVDYWAWEVLDVIRPRVVIAEIQCIWGAERAVTVPYRAGVPDHSSSTSSASIQGRACRLSSSSAGERGTGSWECSGSGSTRSSSRTASAKTCCPKSTSSRASIVRSSRGRNGNCCPRSRTSNGSRYREKRECLPASESQRRMTRKAHGRRRTGPPRAIPASSVANLPALEPADRTGKVPPKTDHYPGLDLLRGFAAVSVVVYHVIEHFKWDQLSQDNVVCLWFRLGWMGVDLFFVISGLVIALSALKLIERNPDDYARIYFTRRLARIVPLHYLTCLLWVVLVMPATCLIRGSAGMRFPT